MPSVEPALSAFVSAARSSAREARVASQGVDTATNKNFSSLLDDTAPPDDTAAPRQQATQTGSESRSRREPANSDKAARRTTGAATSKTAADSANTPAEPNATDAGAAMSDEVDGQVVPGTETTAALASPADAAPSTDGETSSTETGTGTDTVPAEVSAPTLIPVAQPVPVAAPPVIAATAETQTAETDGVDALSAAPAPIAAAATADETPAAPADPKTARPQSAEPAAPEAAMSTVPGSQAPATKSTGKSAAPASKGQSDPATTTDAATGETASNPATRSETSGTAARQEAAPTHNAKTSATDGAGGQPSASETRTAAPAHAATHATLEALQPLPTNATMATAAAAAPTMTQQVAASVPLSGIAVEIAVRAQGGNNSFEIRLDPPELGRIDVKLDVDRHGNVTSHLIVERSETLDLLRRDAPNLERALQDAGLKTGDSALQFSLRDQNPGGDRDARSTHLPDLSEAETPTSEAEPIIQAVRSYRWTGTTSGIDIRV